MSNRRQYPRRNVTLPPLVDVVAGTMANAQAHQELTLPSLNDFDAGVLPSAPAHSARTDQRSQYTTGTGLTYAHQESGYTNPATIGHPGYPQWAMDPQYQGHPPEQSLSRRNFQGPSAQHFYPAAEPSGLSAGSYGLGASQSQYLSAGQSGLSAGSYGQQDYPSPYAPGGQSGLAADSYGPHVYQSSNTPTGQSGRSAELYGQGFNQSLYPPIGQSGFSEGVDRQHGYQSSDPSTAQDGVLKIGSHPIFKVNLILEEVITPSMIPELCIHLERCRTLPKVNKGS